MYKGVLFDFDGVLANTMESHFRAWHKALLDFGADLKEDDYYPFEGTKLSLLSDKFTERFGLDADKAGEITKKKEKYYLEGAKDGVYIYPGVYELVGELRKKNIPCAIVTAGLRDRMEKSLPKDFLNMFTALVTGDTTEHGKPHPDPYLMGARMISVLPEECIAVENAPLGVDSAKAAGSYCIAITSTCDNHALRAADEVISSFEDLRNTKNINELLV
ncbi:MAG: HAD family phosphatase [bacterium]|nr:HAD family phosphatase [bacterium]